MAKTGFRETMWFKLGDVTVEEGGDDEAPVPLPIEDRYGGEVMTEDTAAFSLRTGTTAYIRKLRGNLPVESEDDVSMESLVGEMKHSKPRLFAIGASIAAACTAFALYLV